MAETNNTPNLAEVQKIHDALAEKSLEKNTDPLAKLNPDSFSAEYTFKTEYERQMYLVSLNQGAIDAAITWLKTSEGKKVQDAQKMVELLNQRKGDLEKLQRETRAKLHDSSLVIDATIPGPKWEKSGKEVTVEGKKYGVEKREGSEKGKSDLKIDAGLATSVLIKDVPDDTDTIDAVLKAYETANQKDANDNSPLKSGWFGRTVKYEEIKDQIQKKPVSAPASVSSAPSASVMAPVEAPKSEKSRVAEEIKKVTGLKDGYRLVVEEKSPNKKFEDGGAVILKKGDKMVKYMSLNDPKNADAIKNAEGMKSWASKYGATLDTKGAAKPEAKPDFSVNSLQQYLKPEHGVILKILEAGDKRFNLDIAYNVSYVEGGTATYSMIPKQTIYVTSDQINSLKTTGGYIAKGVEFAGMVPFLEGRYWPTLWAPRYDIYLEKNGTVKLVNSDK